MPRRRLAAVAIAGLAIATTGGCGDDSHPDLDRYVARIKAEKAPPIEPMPEISKYTPFVYDDANKRSPFQPPTPSRNTSNSTIHPDLDRPLDPLEKFPLDALTLVGTLTTGGVTYALIQDPNGIVHRVGPGSHLGQNYGEINHVSNAGVALTEIVPDGNGGYKKRHTMLTPPKA